MHFIQFRIATVQSSGGFIDLHILPHALMYPFLELFDAFDANLTIHQSQLLPWLLFDLNHATGLLVHSPLQCFLIGLSVSLYEGSKDEGLRRAFSETGSPLSLRKVTNSS